MIDREIRQSIPAAAETTVGLRPPSVSSAAHPDPEVPVRSGRRKLTTAYKLKVLHKVAGLKSQGNGKLGAYLRGEGLYYSSITSWQKQLENGTLTERRGKKEKARQALLNENKRLRKKLEQTEKKLRKTEIIVELQKKISDLMGIENEKST